LLEKKTNLVFHLGPVVPPRTDDSPFPLTRGWIFRLGSGSCHRQHQARAPRLERGLRRLVHLQGEWPAAILMLTKFAIGYLVIT